MEFNISFSMPFCSTLIFHWKKLFMHFIILKNIKFLKYFSTCFIFLINRFFSKKQNTKLKMAILGHFKGWGFSYKFFCI